MTIGTEDRQAEDVAAEIFEAMRGRGMLERAKDSVSPARSARRGSHLGL
jgi:hypothetical protein